MRLGITSIQRNRARYLAEWISFHYLVGFRKFYIYLHKCTDNSEEVLQLLRKNYDIYICRVSNEEKRPQLQVYTHSYKEFNHEVDWMAFIDGDEFLFSPGNIDMRKSLEPFFIKKSSGLCVYWMCFGSSNHLKEPEGLVTENFRYRSSNNHSNNRTVKSLIKGGQGDLIRHGHNPHIFYSPLGLYDENDNLITSAHPDFEPTHRLFRINHYITQSREFFLVHKRNVGTAMDLNESREEIWWQKNNINDVYDDSMNFYLPSLKKLMDDL